MAEVKKNNIENLTNFLTKNRANYYPIENEYLSEATDFIKNGYLKMLAVVLQQGGDSSPAQITLFRRMIAGAKAEASAEDYLRMALSIETDDFLKFTEECRESPLRYRFALDAMILSCARDKDKGQIELVADFCEFLKIERKEVQYLANTAKAIVGMDTTSFVDAEELEIESIPSSVYHGYYHLLAPSNMLTNGHMTVFRPTCTNDITVSTLDLISNANTPCVKLANVDISLTDYPLTFTDKEKVIIDGCHFTGGKKYPIYFYKCKEVVIRNTTFENFQSRTLYATTYYPKTPPSLTINNCRFCDCNYQYQDSYGDKLLGSVIYGYDSLNCKDSNDLIVHIKYSMFENCGGQNKFGHGNQAFISNSTCNVTHSCFSDCWHTQMKNRDTHSAMFTPESKATNCTFENCANFN